jgi:RND family efflux transporter MFP subunit
MALRVVPLNRRMLLAGIAFLMPACGRTTNEYVAPPPPKVTAMVPVKHPVIEFIEENGESEAVERAEVRSRVRGFVEKINFEPGQSVNRDTVLYEIEDDEYVAARNASDAEVTAAQAAIKVSDAQVLTAQTEVNRAQREFDRQTTLLAQQATSKTEFDAAEAAIESARALLAGAIAAVESSKASLQQAQAKLEKTELDLAYTKIHAPIDGRVTKTDIKVGNLVDNGTELSAVINDKQVYVNFSISDRQLLELRRARMERSEKPVPQEEWSRLPVLVKLETDEGFPHVGRLDYIDQEGVNAATGSVPLRAVFDNPNGKLLPGLFVRVRMPVSDPQDALLLPARAILRDRDTAFVLVAGENNLVQRREVQLGEQTAGWAVVRQGISETDRVIIDGLQRSRPDMPVDPTIHPVSPQDLPAAFQINTAPLPAADQPSNPSSNQPPPVADTVNEESR